MGLVLDAVEPPMLEQRVMQLASAWRECRATS